MISQLNFLSLSDLEAASRSLLDRPSWAYLAGGAGEESTVTVNIEAFKQLRFRPRPLTNTCAEVNTEISLYGYTLPVPLLLAPTSPQRLYHPDAELATARAAAASGALAIVSSDSHFPLRDISDFGPFWFQLYCYGSHETTRATVGLAEDKGALAIVVTVDCDFVARRLQQWRSGFSCPASVEFGILREVGYFNGPVPPDTRLPRRPLDWREVERLREVTSLPLLVKGVLHPADVGRCLQLGVDGLIVSNHGGRQLDDCIAAVTALPEIVREAAGKCVVLMDSGVRSGLDVVKAIALGANGVCVGRPYLWGLSVGGADGVQAVVELLRDEIEDVCRQLGVARVDELTSNLIVGSTYASLNQNR